MRKKLSLPIYCLIFALVFLWPGFSNKHVDKTVNTYDINKNITHYSSTVKVQPAVVKNADKNLYIKLVGETNENNQHKPKGL